MLIKTSPLITELSGKIGGQAVSTTRDGMVIKNIVQPPRRPTSKQSTQRFSTAHITNKWQFLTLVQQTTFIDTAPNYTYTNRVGDVVARNGFQTFCFLNQNLYLLGLPLIDTAPVFQAMVKPIIEDISNDDSEFVIQGSNLNANYKYIVYAQIHYSLGASSFTDQPLNIGELTESELAIGFDITPLIEGIYSTQNRPYRANIRVVAIDTITGNRDLNPVSVIQNVDKSTNPMILELTVTAGATVEMPFTIGGTYNGVIDWGDGTITNFIDGTGIGSEHMYTIAGTYICTITGIFSGFGSTLRNTNLFVSNILQFGDNVLDQLSFRNYMLLVNVTCVDTPKFSDDCDTRNLFYDCSNLISFNNLNSWDMSETINCSNIFRNTTISVLLSNWILEKCVNLSGAFRDSTGNVEMPNLNPITLNNFSLFSFNGKYNSDLSSLNMSNITSLFICFSGNNVINQDLSAWDVSNVQSFFGCFTNCSNMDFDLGQWDISSATSLSNIGKSANFSTANWDSALIAWEALPSTPFGLKVDINAIHSAIADVAYNSLITTYGWTINEGV